MYKIFLKSVLIFSVLVAGYSGYLKISEHLDRGKVDELKEIAGMRMILIQSRTAWVALARLDNKSSDLNRQKTNLILQIKNSIDEGNKFVESEEISKRQQEVLDELFTKETFEEGIEFLHSNKVVWLLTDMTNLIYKYEFREGQIREQLKLNQ